MMEALLRHKAAAGLCPSQVLASSVFISTRDVRLKTMILFEIEGLQSQSGAQSCFEMQVTGALAPQHLQTQLR